MHPLVPRTLPLILYLAFRTDYDPSEAAALLFVVLFSIVVLAQIVQSSLRRSLWMWPLILGTAGQSKKEGTAHSRARPADLLIS